MKEITSVHSHDITDRGRQIFPSKKYLELPLHPEAKRYFEYGDTWLERLFPFWIAHNIDRFKILILPLLTLLIPFFKGIIPLYKWSIRSKIYHWYEDIKTIDLQLNEELDSKQISQLYHQTNILNNEIRSTTKVPLAYMGEYYNLRMHIALIIEKLEKLQQKVHHV